MSCTSESHYTVTMKSDNTCFIFCRYELPGKILEDLIPEEFEVLWRVQIFQIIVGESM